MKTFDHIAEAIQYAYTEVLPGSNERLYYDPLPKHFDFDREKNPPSFYFAESLADEINVPASALLLGIGAIGIFAKIESLLTQYYIGHRNDIRGNQRSNKN
jgi:hypothetical protein